jgi:hypothetical protein
VSILGEAKLYNINRVPSSTQQASIATPSPISLVTPPPTKFVGDIMALGSFNIRRRPKEAVVAASLWLENRGGPGKVDGWNTSAITKQTRRKIGGRILPAPVLDFMALVPDPAPGLFDILDYSPRSQIISVASGRIFNTYDKIQGIALVYFPVPVIQETLKFNVEDQNGSWSVIAKPTPQPLP